MTSVAELPAGFADKVLSAQSTFRSVMDAMARPGSVQRIASAAGTPVGMMRGTAAIALTLFDHDTPVWLDGRMSATADVAKWHHEANLHGTLEGADTPCALCTPSAPCPPLFTSA